jgi:hypothetical protein
VCILAGLAPFSGQASATGIGPDPIVYGVSCPSSSLCVAVDSHGHAVISTDPTGQAPTWNAASIEGLVDPTAVSCASTAFCVAVDSNGRAATTTDPTAATPSWSNATKIDEGLIHSVSCPSISLCVAVNTEGEAAISTDPAAAAPTWSTTLIDTTSPPLVYPANPHLDGVSCPSTSLCVAVDSRGDTVVSTDPAAAKPAWSAPRQIDSAELTGVSCPSTSLCVAVDTNGDAVLSTDPAERTPTWSVSDAVTSARLTGISCPASELCVAVGRETGPEAYDKGLAAISTDPTAATPTWNVSVKFGVSEIPDLPVLSCASTSLCVLVDAFAALTSTDPTAAAPTWSAPVSIDALPAGALSLKGSPIADGRTLTLALYCNGTIFQACGGVANLTTTELFAGNKRTVAGVAAKVKRSRTVGVGRATFAVKGGETDVVKIKLNGIGIRLLGRFKRLPAILSVTANTPELRVPPRMAVVKTARVVFRVKSRRRG